MKNKFFFLLVAVLIAMLVAPTSAQAYSGVDLQVRDNKTNDFWSWGGTVYIYNNTTSTMITSTPLIYGIVNIDYAPGPLPSMGDSITIFIVTTPGPDGSPGVLEHTYTELSFVPGHYPAPTIQTGTGPNAIELVDFSVTPQSGGNTWLPFVLLIGSVALVSGAVAVVRKRKA